jgi:hypothetical protein
MTSVQLHMKYGRPSLVISGTARRQATADFSRTPCGGLHILTLLVDGEPACRQDSVTADAVTRDNRFKAVSNLRFVRGRYALFVVGDHRFED